MSEPIPDSVKEEIQGHIFAHRKIQAIKVLREETGLGLAEAKQVVEGYTEELRRTAGEKFGPAPKGCGAAAVLMMLVIGMIAIVVLRG